MDVVEAVEEEKALVEVWETVLGEAELAVVPGTDAMELGTDRAYRCMDRFDRHTGRSCR
jgi:hypothetical protein